MIESGTILQGRFLIEERIGEGGMGAVYLAVDQKFGSRVAIKETFYGDPELAEAFEREARLLNSLHHPIFPHVSDHFNENGGHFLVMEYIEGDDMSDLLKRGEVFSVDDVMKWTLDLLDGLDHLHSQDPPIIHRDIKPNNLKLTSRGNVMLLDFGMAKETSGNTLGMRSVFGYSRRYSPLEQIEGTGTDVRSDIFSLGATVFHLLTGKPPVDVLARASAIVSGRPDPLLPAHLLRSDVPELVSAMIHSALALNPDQRFISARAMWNALEFALGLNRDEVAADAPVQDAVIVAAASVVAPEDEFPALEAFRADLDEKEPEGKFDIGIPDTVDHVDTLDSSAPLARAVIHLDSVNQQDDHSERHIVSGPDSRAHVETDHFVAAPTLPVDRARARFSRVSIWLPLLLLCAVLGVSAIYGLFGGTEKADIQPAVTERATEARTEEPATGTETNISQQTPPLTAEPDRIGSNNTASAIDSSSVDEDLPDNARDARSDNSSETSPTNRRGRPQPGDREVVADRPERAESVKAGERKVPTRRSRPASQSRRQRAGAERPRIVDMSDEPQVARIETIFTGIPYEKRPRWRERWVDDEEGFRRPRKRERRRNGRRAFPPF